MTALSCRTARVWMQAIDELSPVQTTALDAHLKDCPACREARGADREVDRVVLEALQAAVGARTVHQAVRDRLSMAPRPSRRTRLTLRSQVSALGIALVAAMVILFASQLGSNGGTGPVTASAAWRLVRARIGFPLTIDPTRPNHLLVGAGGRVLQSWNAGASWQSLAPLPQRSAVRDVAVDRRQPNRYLVATMHSVLLSTDAGRHWRVQATNLRGAMNMFLVQDPYIPGTFYLGPSVLWKSADGGNRWVPAGRGNVFAPYGIQGLSFGPDGLLYTAIWGGDVAVSSDGGERWKRLPNGLRRNVLGVAAGHDATLWAATDRGVFRSADRGAHWRRTAIPSRFLATSILDAGGYLLAGGDGGVFRSTDGGRHWSLSMAGMPLDPYVYSLTRDPSRPNRVYASLDSDGIFRSDDGGASWTPVNRGIPLDAPSSPAGLVLFARNGELWHTDSYGDDPGNLTVERDVRLAALSPDGAAIAYLAGQSDGWAVRDLSAGGSAARTLWQGTGAPPRELLWSPSSSLVAIVAPTEVTVTDLARRTARWRLAPGSQVIGWAADGQQLLVRNGSTGRVIAASWQKGTVRRQLGVFPARSISAPDGRHLAFVAADRLHISTWANGRQEDHAVPSGCRPSAWSDDSRRLLLQCGDEVEVRTIGGNEIARKALPDGAFWAPGSHTRLLYFRRGALWGWTVGRAPQRLVPDAQMIRASDDG